MTEPSTNADRTIAFQGAPGAYSQMACAESCPDMEPLPCATFEDAFAAVCEGRAKLAMIPIENSIAGRVADIHHLLPDSGLYIVGESFQRVKHQLLASPGAAVEGLRVVHSHVQALSQCRGLVRALGLEEAVHGDTARAARDVAALGDPAHAAIASALAAKTYGLDIVRADIEDASHNTTRFVIMARDDARPATDGPPVMTSILFQVRNVPASLYKALGGFATNGVNIVKLESYQLGGSFNATQFYADLEGHPEHPPVARALDELDYFCAELKVLGVYPAHAFRGLS